MTNYHFVSDLHFGHGNIIKYSNRPFSDVQEMDEILIKNWNDHVAYDDCVYFLGDFCYRSKDAAARYRKRLNGNIFFIEGNHDSAAWQIRHTFGWYKEVASIAIGDQKIWLSHYSHEVWNKSHHGVWHLYGHSHNSLPESPNRKSFDVGIDATAMRLVNKRQGDPISGTKQEDYRPLSFKEVKFYMDQKQFIPVDHHGEERFTEPVG